MALSIAIHGPHAAVDEPPGFIRLTMTKRAQNGEVDRLLASHNAKSATRSLLREDVKLLGVDQANVVVAEVKALKLDAVETWLGSGEGSHTVQVLVGGQPRELIIDTGSGKTAFICDGCQHCGVYHHHKPFVPTANTEFLSCNFLSKVSHGCIECEDNKCKYGQKYVEGDYWLAYKAVDIIGFSSNHEFEAPIEFGCIFEQNGVFVQQSSDGIMGFSKHPDSIFEQFYRHKVTHSRIFSQCLSSDGGSLAIGGIDMAINKTPVVYTPLRDTGLQYWTVWMEGLDIGDTHVEVDKALYNQNRGCVFDSGTTFIYLPASARDTFVRAWKQATGMKNAPTNDETFTMDDETMEKLPNICFNFMNAARLCVPPTRYFVRLSRHQYGGTLFFSDSAQSTIIGANALADHNIIYDVEHSRIGISEASCDVKEMKENSELQMVQLETRPGGDMFSRALDWEYWQQWSYATLVFFAAIGLVVGVQEQMEINNAARATAAPPPEMKDGTLMTSPRGEVYEYSFFLFED
ncbi:TPA: hypothetical protein N0F65_000046 [Lagenidium giganteum]|uniref:Peptidase A1 domain-containing protein n=1 Tax=Lagenidium giganteum TaxID=4803 RepID=A0AAV2YRI7_9STRA|nr:TPA: hypothetical protein N0F65_000046 [Lagenidium giganteum]